MQVSSQTTLTSKGQVVITKDIRDALGLKAGDKIVEVVSGRTIHLVPIPKDPAMALLGMMKNSKFTAQQLEDWMDEGELE